MKNRTLLPHPATLFLLLSVGVAFVSWVESIYGEGNVQNLFTGESLRWLLENADRCYLASPVFRLSLWIAPGVGILLHSGLYDALLRVLHFRPRRLSRKEKRALALATVMAALCLLLVGILAWGPWTTVRSITGSLAGSPLEQGLPLLLSVTMILTGVTYGYATDAYDNDRDVVSGMAYCLARGGGYFITLFFVVLFFALLDYTGLAPKTTLYEWFKTLFLGAGIEH